MNTPHSDPQTIVKSFEKLRTDYQQIDSKIATKQDIAARQRDKEIVEQASSYTSESIFQSLAQLQTTFGQSTEKLAKDMTTEVEKLAQISRAIQVENQRFTDLQNIQIAAEALNILQQEHKKAVQNLQEDYQQKHDALEKEIAKQREMWEKRREDNENLQKKQEKEIEKKRSLEEEDYDYGLKRQQTEDTDSYDKRKRALDRQLEEENRIKEKDWQERQAFLEKNQAKFEEYKAKVETIPKDISEAMNKAREEAIKDTYRDEENKAKLLEKEREAKRKAFELKIESLNKTIDEQKARIAHYSSQLQAASQQVQQLAVTAVSSGGKTVETS
jgi:DNA repair exonuclease SbcCD ATPase subunit